MSNKIFRLTWPLGVHVDQAHLVGAEGVLELPSGPAVPLVLEPLLLDSPVHVGLGSEGVHPSASEPQRLDALEVVAHHALDRDVSGEYDEVGPGELRAVLLLDRPQDHVAGLVKIGIVRPRVQGREPDVSGVPAAPTVEDTIGTGGVPSESDHEGRVGPVVSRPGRVRRCDRGVDVSSELSEVDALELRLVCGGLAQRRELRRDRGRGGMGNARRSGRRGVLGEMAEVYLIGPPVLVGRGLDELLLAVVERALRSWGRVDRGRLVVRTR